MDAGDVTADGRLTVTLRVRPWHPTFWPVLWAALPCPWWRKPWGLVYVLWAVRPWRGRL